MVVLFLTTHQDDSTLAILNQSRPLTYKNCNEMHEQNIQIECSFIKMNIVYDENFGYEV